MFCEMHDMLAVPLPASTTSPDCRRGIFAAPPRSAHGCGGNAAASSRPSGSTGRPSLPNSPHIPPCQPRVKIAVALKNVDAALHFNSPQYSPSALQEAQCARVGNPIIAASATSAGIRPDHRRAISLNAATMRTDSALTIDEFPTVISPRTARKQRISNAFRWRAFQQLALRRPARQLLQRAASSAPGANGVSWLPPRLHLIASNPGGFPCLRSTHHILRPATS